MNDGAEVVGLGQVSRSVASVERAVAWYRDVLGLAHLYTFDKIAFFDCGGTRLMLSESAEPPPAESILYFRVADIDSAWQRFLERGVASISAPHMIHRHEDGTEEWMAFFEDLEGRPIAIMSSASAKLDP